MLKAYGEDGYGAEGGLDIVEFTRAFCKLREQRGISVRLYRPSRTPQDTRDHSTGRNDDRSVSNPLLPGQSATQTRAGVGKIGTRAPPYNGYAMPAEATSSKARPQDAFMTLMETAYFEDVLIGDHFEKYARLPRGERTGDKVLDAAKFASAIANLGIDWKERECGNVFSWIHEAHNAFNNNRGRDRSRDNR